MSVLLFVDPLSRLAAVNLADVYDIVVLISNHVIGDERVRSSFSREHIVFVDVLWAHEVRLRQLPLRFWPSALNIMNVVRVPLLPSIQWLWLSSFDVGVVDRVANEFGWSVLPYLDLWELIDWVEGIVSLASC